MITPLHQIPTLDLLIELGRRCEAITAGQAPPWAANALAAVAAEEQIDVRELIHARNRRTGPAAVRHLAIAVLVAVCPDRSWADIAGIWFQHHSMVPYAVEKITILRQTHPSFAQKWDRIITAVGGDAFRRTAPRGRIARKPWYAASDRPAATPA